MKTIALLIVCSLAAVAADAERLETIATPLKSEVQKLVVALNPVTLDVEAIHSVMRPQASLAEALTAAPPYDAEAARAALARLLKYGLHKQYPAARNTPRWVAVESGDTERINELERRGKPRARTE